ncbi:MAG: DNA replication/repair protein RecF [Lachnospiraceae bacterium]|nr:DNA replication/repair protein RecF [Lachnospiraceae bacterium]
MKINQLELSEFRNYESLSVEFDPSVNILYGDNAQGKTNVLEAIYLCGTTKSHKGSKEKEMIRLSSEESHIRMQIEKAGIPHRIDMHLRKNKTKGVAIDGIPIKRSSELMGLLHIVFFSPEDLSMIKNGPGERRRFIDLELCQLDPTYLYHLSNYNRAVNQRNNLLKQIGLNKSLKDTVEVWDSQLMEHGSVIIDTRRRFVEELNQLLPKIHAKLSGGKEELYVRYEPNVTKQEFGQKLAMNLDRDLALKATGNGPHRDDISFYVGDKNLKSFGSQGQQRTAALSLKLAEIELVRSKIKESPVLLLDDVLSELDRNRQSYLLESITDLQTIITCTGLEEFVDNKKRYHKIFHVVEGIISEI